MNRFCVFATAMLLAGCNPPPETAEVQWTCGETTQLQAPHLAEHEVLFVEGEAPDAECAMAAQLALLQALAPRFVVLPVGLYEGAVLDSRLHAGEPEADVTVYRVWRESPGFQSLMSWMADEGVRVRGGLMRYHARAKVLFAAEMAARYPEHAEPIARLMGGPERLRDQGPAVRDSVRALLSSMAGSATGETLQWLQNYESFVELEGLRAEEADLSAWLEQETSRNLEWLLANWSQGDPLVYWRGRGAAPVQTDATSATIRVTFR